MTKNKFAGPPATLATYGSPTQSGQYFNANAVKSNQPFNQSKSVRSSRYPNYKKEASFVSLTEDIFSVDTYDDGDAKADDDEDFEASENYLTKDYEPYQLSLELETTDELRKRLHQTIRRYEIGYEKMCAYAIRWHYLMEDVENIEQIHDQFNNLQMVRKLMGGNVF